MSGINRAIVLGRVGKDPETRYTSDGKAVTTLSIATSYGKGDNEVTEWHRAVAWEKAAEVIDQYVKKGHLIYIEGPLSTRKWTDKDGNDRYTTEIRVMNFSLIGKTVRDDDEEEERRPARQAQPQREAPRQQSMADLDDDVPF